MKSALFTTLLSSLFILMSCGTKNKEAKIPVDSLKKNNTEMAVKKLPPIVAYTKYNLPLPVELYRVLKNENIPFNQEMLHPTVNVSKYISNVSKSINLGFYTSDLAYLTVYEQNQLILEYFSTSKNLAQQLNIAQGYDKEMIKRMKESFDNNDSLRQIATDSYWQTCRYLEINKSVNILPFVVVGGWLESIYLTINSFDGKIPNKKVLHELIQQKASLQNLMNYLIEVMADTNAYLLNVDIQKLRYKLQELYKTFEALQNAKNEKEIDNRMNELSQHVKKIREFYTNL